MSILDVIPDWLKGAGPEAEAHKRFEREEKNHALEAARRRLGELDETIRVYSMVEPFLEAKRRELQQVQDAMVFSKGEETVLLQGRAQALFGFVKVPEEAKREREKVANEIHEMETDAG